MSRGVSASGILLIGGDITHHYQSGLQSTNSVELDLMPPVTPHSFAMAAQRVRSASIR